MYRIRLGCAAYAQMNIILRQTTVCLGGVGVGSQARRMRYIGGHYENISDRNCNYVFILHLC